MVLTFVTTITATVVVPPGSVTADQVSDLNAQAGQIAKDLVLEQLQIGAYQQQADVDGAKVQRDEAEIGSTEGRIRADDLKVSRDRTRLEDEAVSAYINMNTGLDGAELLFAGNQSETVVRAQYEQVTSGDINLAMDALRSDQKGLNAQRAALEDQETQDQATTNQEASLLSHARQTRVELQSKQSQITGELAVAVAQQQQAQAVAATRAVQAAQAAAAPVATSSASRSPTASTTTTAKAAASPSATSTTTPGNATGASSADPSLPPFLQCVLQAESGGNYQAVSPGGAYMGGFQFSQATWNAAAQLAGMPQLVNVPPNQATPAQQDDLAIALYSADGQQPWNDSCRNS